MSSLKTVALSLAAVLVTAASVQAAPHHTKRTVHHRASHAAAHHRAMAPHSSTAMRGGSVGGDHSADALNAQSLARSQNVGQ